MAFKTPYDFYSPGVVTTDDARAIDAMQALAPGLFGVTKAKTADQIVADALVQQEKVAAADDAEKKRRYIEELASSISPEDSTDAVLSKTANAAAKYGQASDLHQSVLELDSLRHPKPIKFDPEKGYYDYIPGIGMVTRVPAQKNPNKGGKPRYQKYVEEKGDMGIPTGRMIGITRDGKTEYITMPQDQAAASDSLPAISDKPLPGYTKQRNEKTGQVRWVKK